MTLTISIAVWWNCAHTRFSFLHNLLHSLPSFDHSIPFDIEKTHTHTHNWMIFPHPECMKTAIIITIFRQFSFFLHIHTRAANFSLSLLLTYFHFDWKWWKIPLSEFLLFLFVVHFILDSFHVSMPWRILISVFHVSCFFHTCDMMLWKITTQKLMLYAMHSTDKLW